jgi:hypothetical protein
MFDELRDRITDFFGGISQMTWAGLAAVVLLVGAVIVLNRTESDNQVDVVQLTLNAVSTESSRYVPTLASNLTRTPVQAAVTAAAPTLALSGRREIRQYAASAEATSERDPLAQGAVQAAGPPNTPGCGDYRSAWATADANGSGALTLLYPELVTPTAVVVYETYNPGFVTRIDVVDVYGEVHTIYQAQPRAQSQCPYTLIVRVEDADYEGNRVVVYVDQTTSGGGWNEIDAVELIGVKH